MRYGDLSALFLAIGVYPMLFKQLPPRWMGITYIVAAGFGLMACVLVILLDVGGAELPGIEIDLSTWKDLARESATIATLWYALSNGDFHSGDAHAALSRA
jgi:hypothetical protein